MKKADVKVGRDYYANVSGSRVVVRITAVSPHGGWIGRNEKTGREVRVRTAGRLHGEAGPKALRRSPDVLMPSCIWAGTWQESRCDAPACPVHGRGVVVRYALVSNARDAAQVQAYLPMGYRVARGADGMPVIHEGAYVIEGRDEAGWTLDGYVIPRFASGLIWATEIDLSHPVMKKVPA